MKNGIFRFSSILTLAAQLLAFHAAADNSLQPGFMVPPDSAKPNAWYHWMNGHISREAITRDLESMKQTGVGGFTLFNTSEGTPPGPVIYLSDHWLELLAHTISEAHRLGLEMGMHNGAGWSSSGGPWVTPDRAMQEVVWTEKRVQGPIEFEGVLEIPEPALGIERDMARNPAINKRYYVSREKVRGYYRDIVLLAFPTLKGDTENKPFRLDNWKPKAGFSKLSGGYQPGLRPASPGNCINTEAMVNLSSRLDKEGRLRWQVPAGDWTLLRIGYQPTGRQNHPAPVEGRGLEVDKMSAAAMDFYWQNSIARFLKIAGAHTGKTFKGLVVDSYEVGHQNWSATFAQDFERRRGYDLTKYLPALTGRVVDDVWTTERFLWDFRKTISDLIVQNYYRRIAELCRQNGLTFFCEAYGSFGNTDDFAASGQAQVPMAEWWAFRNEPGHAATARLAASAAHTYGRSIADAEAFTGPPDRIFEEYPFSLKGQGDHFFCQGINRFSFHSFVHDPYGKLPGLGLGTYGSRFGPANTWWPFARPWLEYVARCQYLLQQGRFVADLLYYVGEDAPQAASPREELNPVPPAGYDYDFATREVLESIQVSDGRLELPSGMSYRVLVLPPVRHMRVEVLQRVEQLVRAGAVVVGPKPLRTSGLEGGDKAESALNAMAERLWGQCDGKAVTVQEFGQGRVYWGKPMDAILGELKLRPDFSFEVVGKQQFETQPLYPGGGMEFIHRKVGATDLYFVSNQHQESKTVEALFRVGDRMPELWHPDNGRTELAARFRSAGEGRMAVTLSLDPAGSVFVLFRDALKDRRGIVAVEFNGQAANVSAQREGNHFLIGSAKAGEFVVKSADGSFRKAKIEAVAEPLELKGPWQVRFPQGSGAPEQITMARLMSLAQHDDPEVRHFSGTAIYRTQVEIPAAQLGKGQRQVLELGDVQVIAEVLLNGKSLGVLWKAPYSVDVSRAVRAGRNEIQIRVANLWVNRLIGDQQYPDDCQWTTNTGSTAKGKGLAEIPEWVIKNTVRPVPQRKAFVAWQWPHLKDKPLLPSGLIGPVRVVSRKEAEVK